MKKIKSVELQELDDNVESVVIYLSDGNQLELEAHEVDGPEGMNFNVTLRDQHGRGIHLN